MKLKLISTLLMTLAASSSAATLPTKHTTPKDIGVINKERIEYWLEKRGELPTNATPEQRQRAIANYVNLQSLKEHKLPAAISKQLYINERTPTKGALTVKGVKVLEKQRQSANSEQTTTVKVLALLVDFPDLKHDNNRLTASDTSMYYDEYPVAHYNDLLFSTSGYAGPSGQSIESAYQFYQQESGGSLFFTGQANGWITADNNAAHYGGNDENGDDQDVQALVLEAVTKAVSELNIDLAEYDNTDLFDVDGDGNVNEPDGIIDHVMLFHSSVGEEAGGGVLAEDAIWSHRFFVFDPVSQEPVPVPGSDIKLYGYTINPIDAATGVVVHEFGHDLGLPDEYDTANGLLGSPVGDWSVMASGSWVGSPAGTRPVGFSAYARDELQRVYQGNWIDQLTIDLTDLDTQTINLVEAINHDGDVNQVKVLLPNEQVEFAAPFAGDYQYYSNSGHQLNHQMTFSVSVPSDTPQLEFMARWEIEVDYDYAQVLINGEQIAGSHTKVSNQFHPAVTNFITGLSSDVAEAQGDDAWVQLTFDLVDYAGSDVNVTIAYVTDEAAGGFGIAVDDIKVTSGSTVAYSDDAETADVATLTGFTRMGDKIDALPHNYYIQLRSHTGTDAKLGDSDYDAGVLVWYRNQNVRNNRVNAHPGEVFIGVVDADQNPIVRSGRLSGTGTQIRDAAFSQFQQSSLTGDNHLSANSVFSDKNNYSFAHQPESGIDLPIYGLRMEVTSQSADSSSATIELSNDGAANIRNVQDGLTVELSLADVQTKAGSVVTWTMGDGTELTGATVQHTYAAAGDFDVSVDYETDAGSSTLEKPLKVGEKVAGSINATINGLNVSFDADLTGGEGSLTYRWQFGDGSDLSKSVSADHDYETAGTYQVTLTVTDQTAQSYSFTTEVVLAEALNVEVTRTVNNLNATFGITVSGGDENYTYAWDFGDGNTSTLAQPTHTYANAGTYNVSVTVTDGNGVAGSASTTLIATSPVVTPPSSKSGGSGGGSLGYFLFIVAMITGYRRIKN
ncbi:immune inhibitor A domain-containing protein [Thalassotalea fusca]